MILVLVPRFEGYVSLVKKWSEVEDVVEATEAVCARRADNSRVSRLTYVDFVRYVMLASLRSLQCSPALSLAQGVARLRSKAVDGESDLPP